MNTVIFNIRQQVSEHFDARCPRPARRLSSSESSQSKSFALGLEIPRKKPSKITCFVTEDDFAKKAGVANVIVEGVKSISVRSMAGNGQSYRLRLTTDRQYYVQCGLLAMLLMQKAVTSLSLQRASQIQ